MSQARDAGRLPISLIAYVAWTLVTVFGMRWAGDGTKKPLIESVTHSISWNLVMAVALLAIVTVAMRWRDLKFVAPKPMGSLRVLPKFSVCSVPAASSPQRHAARDGLAMPSPTLADIHSGAHP